MPDLPIVLAVLAIFLTIVTLVGHGIWVLLAAIFGGGRKKASPNCPFCGHSTAADRERCDWCGRQLASPVAKELNDLAAVRRQLQRFRQNGTLKPEAVDRLLGRLQEYRQRLLQPVEEKRAAPAVAALIVEEPERSAEAPPAAPRKETIRPPVPEIIAKPQATIDAVPQPAPHPEAAAPPVPQFIARPQAASTPVPQPAPRSRYNGAARAPAATAASGPAVAVLERDAGGFHGAAEYSLGRTDRRIALRLFVGRAGGQPVEDPRPDPLLQILHLRIDHVGPLRRRPLCPSSLEAGIDQPGLAGDCHAPGALEFRCHGDHGDRGERGLDALD